MSVNVHSSSDHDSCIWHQVDRAVGVRVLRAGGQGTGAVFAGFAAVRQGDDFGGSITDRYAFFLRC